MRKITLLLTLCFALFQTKAQDTFSIVAVDPATGEVGAAGASCVDGVGDLGGLIDIISAIIPGRGGINSQAYVCIPNANLANGIEQMEAGASPAEIISWLFANDSFPCGSGGPFDDPTYRQYGIADFNPDTGAPRTAGYTGSSADDYKDDIQGPTYSVQGNILLNATVLENMEANFVSTTGTLADKLMAAMQGANFAGADARCLDRGTSSTSAFLQVYRPDDTPGNPYLRLNIEEMPFGEEPIDSLQTLYDAFLSVEENSLDLQLRAFPNPASEFVTIAHNPNVVVNTYTVYDISGKRLNIEPESQGQGQVRLSVADLPKGVYFVQVMADGYRQTISFIRS
ncbi:DUF1028 domain-containing protein [Gilvibacter sediminis]|uniref:DUF1028 domain-containing protein n=1 Tax=Gilvibacter sediminis TaxID=379071 RepID=UPI00234FFAA6|nr:DUF1028 domain-containing protein [Gilvibacter sediminis]MDC7998992.1 DUF1028 domain-containing protein [Gilvibacter sediminis]